MARCIRPPSGVSSTAVGALAALLLLLQPLAAQAQICEEAEGNNAQFGTGNLDLTTPAVGESRGGGLLVVPLAAGTGCSRSSNEVGNACTADQSTPPPLAEVVPRLRDTAAPARPPASHQRFTCLPARL